MGKRIIIFIVTIIVWSACQKGVKPAELKIEDRVLDNAGILTLQQKSDLFSLIQDIDQKIGPQIAIFTLDSLRGQRIEELSLRMAEKLRLGRVKKNDGLLVTYVLGDRIIRIEVGRGLERIIGDEVAVRIINEEIVARFDERKYFDGVYAAILRIRKLIEEKKSLIGSKP